MRTIFIIVTTFVVSAALVVAAQGRRPSIDNTFLLRFPRTVDTTGLSISYFLTGPFGGYGSYVRTKSNVREYVIETLYEGKSAKTLKAIIYCPGYGVELLSASPLTVPSGISPFVELKTLPSIPLSGKVVLPKGRSVTSPKIEVVYSAYWSHQFFGISDGAVITFKVASTDVAEDGSFSIMVPDFTRDPVVTSFEKKGVLRLMAREPNTGNMPYILERAEQPGRGAELVIAAEYDGELILYAKPIDGR
jgi:hypothetical protein